MDEEYKSHAFHETREIVPPEQARGHQIIRGMWRYTEKKDNQGNTIRHKARWVVDGRSQEPGLDYLHTFANVAHLDLF